MKTAGVYVMAILYVLAGINHFLKPAMYTRIMPPLLPWPLQLVYISGVFEIVLGILLMPATIRPYAAWGIIALLIAVFPANVQMALLYWRDHRPGRWFTLIRLPLQAVLIAWAWIYTRR